MDTIALADLAPILAAVLGPVLAFAVVVMRYQHVDSTRTRDLIEDVRRENRELIEDVRRENRDGLREVTLSLADARERLARIEGHFGIGASDREAAADAGAGAAAVTDADATGAAGEAA